MLKFSFDITYVFYILIFHNTYCAYIIHFINLSDCGFEFDYTVLPNLILALLDIALTPQKTSLSEEYL